VNPHKIPATLVLLFVCLAPRLWAAEDAPSGKIFFFDEGDNKVVAVDPRTGSVLGRSPIVPTPTRVVKSPDGRRVLLLYSGVSAQTDEYGNSTVTKASAILLDGETCQQVASVELGFGLGEWTFDRAGKRLAVLSSGSQPNQGTAHAEITILSTETGEVQGRVKLERPAQNLDLAPDGQTVAVYQKRLEESGSSQLRFIDLSSLETVGKLSLEGAPFGPIPSSDGDLLYFVEPGRPHKKRAKNVDGRIYVVSLARRALEKTLDAGSNPSGPWLDAKGRLLLLSDVPEDENAKKPDGELRIVSGADVVKTLRVAWSPRVLRLSEDESRAYVVGPLHISTVDLVSLQTTGRVDVDTGPIRGFAVSPDGKRAFVSYGEQRLAAVDLETHKLLNRMTTGRRGMALLHAVAVADLVMTLSSGAAASAAADRYGRTRSFYGAYVSKGPSDGPLLTRPDGKVAYALNRHTQDITLVDGQTGKSLDHIHVGTAATLFRLKGGNLIAACDNSEIYLVDTQTQKQEEIKDLGSINVVRFSPDRARLLFLGTKKILFLDTSTGKPVGEVQGLNKPTLVAF
jgi:DNA-binding beta-propeller fold protein YncE